MTFKISLSQLYNDQLEQIKEMGEINDYKRIAQNIKATVKDLEKLEKAGITVNDMTMRKNVPNTNYVVSYKVKTNPHKKLIVKKVLRHR